jgi:hypothetical protein
MPAVPDPQGIVDSASDASRYPQVTGHSLVTVFACCDVYEAPLVSKCNSLCTSNSSHLQVTESSWFAEFQSDVRQRLATDFSSSLRGLRIGAAGTAEWTQRTIIRTATTSIRCVCFRAAQQQHHGPAGIGERRGERRVCFTKPSRAAQQQHHGTAAIGEPEDFEFAPCRLQQQALLLHALLHA